LESWSKNIKLMSTVIFIITLLLIESSYTLAYQTDQTETIENEVTIEISVEEPVYLLVPTNIIINVTDSAGNPIRDLSGEVYINDVFFTKFTTSDNGDFSFMWIPEELLVYSVKVVTFKTDIYAAGEKTEIITVEFSFEALLKEAIRELDNLDLSEHHVEKKIFAIERDIMRALKYAKKEEYLKAFLRLRHATRSLEKLTKLAKHYNKYNKFDKSLSGELRYIAYKLVVAVRYKVEESLKNFEVFDGCSKKTHGIKLKRMRSPSEVLLELAWRFYYRGIDEIEGGWYSKAISWFIVAYCLVRIALRFGQMHN